MPDLNDLRLRNDVVRVEGDPTQIPEQPPARRRMPQPRKYLWQLPQNLSSAWQKRDVTMKEGPDAGKVVERLALNFNQDHPLTIVEDPLGQGEFVGETPMTTISDVERKRQKDKLGKAPVVSDLFFFMRDGLELPILPEEDNTSKGQRINQRAGDLFWAEVELQANCPSGKDIYQDGKKMEGVKGCGARYYQKAIPREPGSPRYVDRFTCGGEVDNPDGTKRACGAGLFVNVQLLRFKPWLAQEEEEVGVASLG